MSKKKTPDDEKLDGQDFDLFGALAAIDRKDYSYFSRLTHEQQKKFVPFMMIKWMSAVKGQRDLQQYYLQSTELNANKYLFNENVSKHPELQWMMLCAASPGVGKQFHQFVPQIKEKITKLIEPVKISEMYDYFRKIYPKASNDDLYLLAETYVETHNKKRFIAEKFPDLKYDDIEVLAEMITDEDIKKYKEASGEST